MPVKYQLGLIELKTPEIFEINKSTTNAQNTKYAS